MLFTCPSGCQVDIGMSRSRQLNRCKDHGEVLRYAKSLTRKEPASPPPAKPRKGLKRGKSKRTVPRWLTEGFRDGVDEREAPSGPHDVRAFPSCWLASHDPRRRPCSG